MQSQTQSEDRSDRFERLFREQYAAVAGYVGRRAEDDLIDDLVDEVFLVAWRRLERVPEDARPWLLAVARNVLGTHIRGARRSRALTVRIAAAQVDWVSCDRPFATGDVAAALAALKPKDREALLLVNWEGLMPSEAARALGDTATAFRVRLHRARRRLRAALEAAAEDDEPRPQHESRPQQITVTKEVPNV